MRNTIFKWLLVIVALLLADLLIMIFLGCFSGLCHASNKFFCSAYCYFGIALLSASIVFSLYFIFRKKKA